MCANVFSNHLMAEDMGVNSLKCVLMSLPISRAGLLHNPNRLTLEFWGVIGKWVWTKRTSGPELLTFGGSKGEICGKQFRKPVPS